MIVPTADTNNDLYQVILIESDDDFAVICPGIPGAVSQGADMEEALKMIADAMAMCRLYPLPGEESPARREELCELGKAKIAERWRNARKRVWSITSARSRRSCYILWSRPDSLCHHTYRRIESIEPEHSQS